MRRSSISRGIGVVAVLALVACPATPPPARASQHHQVELRDVAMQPGRLEVAVGDTVTWTNRDIIPHTVTTDGGAWDSGSIEGGKAWSHVVTRADSAGYTCRFHAGMVAQLVQR